MKKYLVIAAFLQIVWGLVPSASRFVISEIPVELYVALRWSISGVIFVAYLFVTRTWRRVSLRSVLAVSALGIFGYGVGSFGFLYGLKIGGVTNFALMAAVGPVITSLMSVWMLRERPGRLFYLALPLCVLGLALLGIGKAQVSSVAIVGLSAALILGALILEALVFVFSQKFQAEMGAAQYLGIAQVSAAIFLWFLQGVVFHQGAEIMNLSLKGIFAALFVSIVACVLCYAILYWLLNHIDGHRLALFDGFHMLSATTFGVLLFDEPLRPLMLVGGALILIALIAGNLPARDYSESTGV